MTRDERVARGAAHPPTRRHSNGVDYCCPTDSVSGGTWISVNQHGLVACVLNGREGRSFVPQRSRGELPLLCMRHSSVGEAAASLAALDPTVHAPFIVVVLTRADAAIVSGGGGVAAVTERPDAHLVTSSSIQFDEAWTQRLIAFRERGMPWSLDTLVEAHAAHGQRRDLGPCVHSAHVRSVSLSHVAVRAGRRELRYWNCPPCQAQCTESVVASV